MNETIRTIKSRRSTRTFSRQPIKDDELEAILEAGLFAPSAGNGQPWHLTVIRDKNLLDELSAASKAAVKKGGSGYLLQLANNDKYHVFYDAPAAVVVSGETQAMMSQTDCAAATQNMLLAAESLNIGSCWIGFIAFLFMHEDGQGYKKRLGIPGGYQPYYAVALGHKTRSQANAPARRENTVSYL